MLSVCPFSPMRPFHNKGQAVPLSCSTSETLSSNISPLSTQPLTASPRFLPWRTTRPAPFLTQMSVQQLQGFAWLPHWPPSSRTCLAMLTFCFTVPNSELADPWDYPLLNLKQGNHLVIFQTRTLLRVKGALLIMKPRQQGDCPGQTGMQVQTQS